MRSDWKEVRIKNLGNIVTGSTPTPNEENWDGDINWCTPTDLNSSVYIYETSRKITETGYNSCGTKLFPPKSIILSTRAPIGKIAIAMDYMCTNQGCKTIVPNRSIVNSEFLYFYLLNRTECLQSLGSGSTFTELSTNNLNSLLIPLPPLATQHAIANYLDEKLAVIDRNISLLEQKRERYIALRKSLINKTVRYGLNPDAELRNSGIEWFGEIPKHWEVKRLKEISKVESSGIDKKIVEGEELTKIVNYVDVYNNQRHELYNSDDYMVVSASAEKIKSKKLKKGDILITPSSETVEDIGISSVVMEDLEGTLFSYHILRIQFSQNIDINFKKYVFNNTFVQNYFSSVSTGTTRKILSLSKIYNLQIPIPPLSEQVAIAEYLDKQSEKIDRIVENINAQLGKLAQLKKSLINECVTGEREVGVLASSGSVGFQPTI